MSANPMKRQARNSFLLGMVITILIAGVIIVFLFLQMKKLNEANQAYKANLTKVAVLTQDVKSGDVLTADMFSPIETTKTSLPTDYVDISTALDAYSLYTKDGFRIMSRYKNNEQHLYLNDNDDESKQTEVFMDDETGRYYIIRGGSNEYIETVEAPVLAKIDLSQNSIVTQAMITRSDEIRTDDVRTQEYNTIVLPIDLITGDYIDIRLKLPNGQDFIVVSKKRVTVPEVNGEYLADTIQLEMSEDEILTMSSAIVENWYVKGSTLYANKYAEAGMQNEATPTYVARSEVTALMDSDSNIVTRAKTEIAERYNRLASLRNDYINSALTTNGDESGVQTGTDSSIAATLEARQEYLESLAGGGY